MAGERWKLFETVLILILLLGIIACAIAWIWTDPPTSTRFFWTGLLLMSIANIICWGDS